MTVVRRREDLANDYRSTRATAQAVFKDSNVYIERYLEAPFHTEVQLVCDTHGNGVYFGERDCSVQRRHQKLIEEAPSIHLTPEMRKDIGEKAVAGATLDRLLRRRDDGVPPRPRGQPRVHGDERAHPGRAPGQRDDHGLRPDPGADPGRRRREAVGHAGGRRASRATRSSAASTPRIPTRTSRRPRAGSRRTSRRAGRGRASTRTAIPGWMISPFYDSLIAKLIVWAPDRERAIDRMAARAGRVRDLGARREDHDPVPPEDPAKRAVSLGRRHHRLRRAVHGRGAQARSPRPRVRRHERWPRRRPTRRPSSGCSRSRRT